MKQQKTVTGIIRLTRYKEYWISTIATSLLGAIFSGLSISFGTILPLIFIILANILAVGFTFMINDIEDAADDALNPDKINRNPISAGLLRRRNAYTATLLVAIAAIFIYYFYPSRSFVTGLLTIFIGTIYSWKGIRLKGMPIVDLISHGFMLAGFQFATVYFSFAQTTELSAQFLLPLSVIVLISMYGELINELRDFTYDEIAGVKHTASYIGKKNAMLLMRGLLLLVGGIIVYGIISLMIPLWFVGFFGISLTFCLIYSSKTKHKEMRIAEDMDLFNPIMGIATIGFGLWLLVRSLSF